MKIVTNSSSQTRKLGKILAEKIIKKRRKKALVLGLKGDLGGGKTTFLQGFARGLGIKEKVLSPTFIIMRKYEVRSTKKRGNLQNFRLQTSCFYHFDCYRIQKPKEVLDLSFKKVISNSKNIIAIEWADKIKKIMPKNTIWIKFEFINENKRKIKISKN